MFSFQNLSFGKKLAVAVIVFNVSTALMAYYLIAEKDNLINFANLEIDGVEYLHAAHAGLRALTAPKLSPDDLNSAIEKLKQAQLDDGGALNVAQKAEDVRSALALAAANAKIPDDAIAKTTDLMSTLSDNSNITLDPDMDANHVGDLLVNQSTALLTKATALTGAALDLDADKSDNHKIAFAQARDGLSAAAGTFASSLAKAIKGNQDGTVEEYLESGGASVASTVEKVMAQAKTDDRKELADATADLAQAVNSFTTKDGDEMVRLLNTRTRGLHATLYMQLGMISVLFIVGGIIAWLIARSLTKPIQQVCGVMGRLAQGDLSVEIPSGERTDEIGSLIVALKGLYDGAVNRDKARRAERARVDTDHGHAEKIAAFSDTFNGLVRNALENVKSAVENLDRMADSVAKNSETASKQAGGVAAAAEKASTNIRIAAAVSEELSISIRDISSRIAQANGTAQKAVREAQETRVIVHTLSTATSKIGEVVNVINHIAGQTNLLGLNATIEATRAGEAGKGFAVVASEVKLLAKQTSQATETISDYVAFIQNTVKNVTTAVEHVDATIHQINEASVAISGAVEEQGAATQEIARSMLQAAQGTSEVTANIAQIAQSIASTDAAARDVQESAKALGVETAKLEKGVGAYLSGARDS